MNEQESSENDCTKTIYCDICLGNFCQDSIMYYMKNCKEHRLACNVCYNIITHKKQVSCPCCNINNIEFLKLPCEEYDVVKEFPFTI